MKGKVSPKSDFIFVDWKKVFKMYFSLLLVSFTLTLKCVGQHCQKEMKQKIGSPFDATLPFLQSKYCLVETEWFAM